MKICFASYEYPPNIFGGAGTYAELLVKGLKKLGVDVHLITHGPKNIYKTNFTQINTPDITKWRRLYFQYYVQKVIKKLDEKQHFDIIHYNEPHLLLSTPKKPIISTFHSTQANELLVNLQPFMRNNVNYFESLPKNIVGIFGDILSAQKSDIIICPCNDLKKNITKYCFIKENSIKVILNGIDISTYNNFITKNTELKKYKLTPNNYILFIGRLDPIKGITSLINAFNQISANNPTLQLAIVGSGPQEKNLKKISEKNERIHFLGHISDNEEKIALYKNAVCLVLPSFYEAIPMVILEAMAAGIPVIASRVGGIPDIVHNEKNGFLIKPGDPNNIAERIQNILDNPELRNRIIQTNISTAKTRFGYDVMATQVLSVYKDLLKEKEKHNDVQKAIN